MAPTMDQAERFQQIESLFHRVRLLEPPDRAGFLDETCGEDLELRHEVESLLAHADCSTGHVDLRPSGDEAGRTIVDRGRVAEGPGTRIGPYKILQQIGEGGFGVVYMAEQEEPVRRKVALKIIKLGMDTKQVIARFEAERQALALMDHPGIARVLDAGATETGRPYFVMELVKGIPITEYCDSRNLGTRERLGVFTDVCHAVQHAHHKGIIHRDIKPSNILVTLHDNRPVPKVIDFGIAKATSHRLTEKTLFTEFRQLIGTPEYMSPDQAEISGLDIDTRTDIYSLGVVLYELLTGTTPFDTETLRTCSYAEVQRIIREVDPEKPSARLYSVMVSGGNVGANGAKTPDKPRSSSAAEIARHRHSEPSSLSRMMRGDLDWIVMKAMEKDRTRRYETASELANDVNRYLDNQPVLAGPPSAVYKLRKFIRRHKVGVATGSLVAAALIVGLSLATVGFVRANNEAARSQAVSQYLQSLITDLSGNDGPGLDEIVVRGRELFGDDHAIVGTALTTRAAALRTAGRLDQAVRAQREAVALYREANPGGHPATAASLASLGELLEERRDLIEAEQTYREALAMIEGLGSAAGSRVEADALERLTSLLNDTADQSRNDEVRALWERTVAAYEAALGQTDRITVGERCRMAIWLHEQGYADAAGPELERALRLARRVLDADDLTLFLTLNARGQHLILHDQDIEGAVPIVEQMAAMSERVWGGAAITTQTLRLQLVALNRSVGRADVASESLQRYIEGRRGAEFRPNLICLALSQQVWRMMEDWIEGQPEVGRELGLYLIDDARVVLAEDSADLAALLGQAGRWLREHGFADDAEPALVERLEILRGASEPDEDDLASALIDLGVALVELERPGEAEPLLRECLERRERSLPENSWLVDSARSALGDCRRAQGDFEEAEQLLLQAVERLDAGDAPAERRDEARERLVRLYEESGRPEDAARWQ
ncbi:MAG: serine/threonine protein kinase [Planctomycetota bacterium]|jgi:serine/threonine protein kinase/tetratricopeptide (TPR) repeat protein